jgi:hypothetical protein
MKTLHVRGGNRHDPQPMGKVKDNILEQEPNRCRSQALSLSPLSTSVKLSDHVNVYYTTVDGRILFGVEGGRKARSMA